MLFSAPSSEEQLLRKTNSKPFIGSSAALGLPTTTVNILRIAAAEN